MTLTRGDVYFTAIELPNPEVPKLETVLNKLIVVLRTDAHELRVPFLVASTFRATDIYAYEVVIKRSEGFFSNDTIIDCRWPYTITKARLAKAKYMFTLPTKIMEEINLSLVIGLQM